MQEQRKYVRVSESLEVKYHPSKRLLGSSAFTKDISQGGICIPTLLRLEPKSVLELQIKLSEASKPIAAKGETIWLSEINDNDFRFLLGIRFIKLDNYSHGRLEGHIRSQLKMNHHHD
jgi:c-di-GMP-binding flagellar brake protein YcgR